MQKEGFGGAPSEGKLVNFPDYRFKEYVFSSANTVDLNGDNAIAVWEAEEARNLSIRDYHKMIKSLPNHMERKLKAWMTFAE